MCQQVSSGSSKTSRFRRAYVRRTAKTGMPMKGAHFKNQERDTCHQEGDQIGMRNAPPPFS